MLSYCKNDIPLVNFFIDNMKEDNVMPWWGYLLIVVALLGGVAIGFFLARKYMMDYLKKNPPINEQMIRVMMMQMGQKPSQKKINQMMNMINKQQQK